MKVPYDPAASLPKVAKRNLGWLLDSLAGVHISDAERATLIHLAAGCDSTSIRNLAAILARARNARSGAEAIEASAELPPVALSSTIGSVIARHGLPSVQP